MDQNGFFLGGVGKGGKEGAAVMTIKVRIMGEFLF